MDGLPHAPTVEVRVDGSPDDAAWSTAPTEGPFVTMSPAPGLAPVGSTELRLLSDDRRLYALFVAHDPDPTRIRAGYGRRDSRVADDGVALYVDPQGRGQRSYVFGCSALGVPFDGTRTTLSDADDLAWDARWDCASTRTPDGYAVEMAIPWRAIRHPADVTRIGLLATRSVARLVELSTWPPVDPNAPSFVAQQVVVDGPGALPVPRGLELIPEVTYGVDQDGPVHDRLAVDGLGAGLTARYEPSQVVEVLATVNPDFSQVESDAARVTVNRRYALDYDEKRPFFLEGQEWFDHPAGDLVYTRSIVSPVYGVRSTVEAGPWTVAALHAVDRHPAPSVSEGGGFTARELRDAEAVDTVVRAKAAVGDGSSVGVLVSDKELPAVGLANRLGGVDASVSADRWAWTGTIGGSSTTDQHQGQLAPAGETGVTYGTDRFSAFVEGTWVSPDFRAENGFVVYADRVDAAGGVYFAGFPDHGPVRKWSFTPGQGDVAVTTSGDPRSYEWEPELSVRFANGWHAHTSVFVDGEAFDGAWLDYRQPNAGAGGPVGRWLDVYGRVYTGTGPFYDPVDPRVRPLDTAELEASVQVGPRLAVSLTGEADRMTDRRSVLYAGFAGRVQALAFAAPDLWLRATVDRDSFARTTATEALAAWEESPGTAVYAGGLMAFAGGRSVGWAAVTKVSWAFRL